MLVYNGSGLHLQSASVVQMIQIYINVNWHVCSNSQSLSEESADLNNASHDIH